MSGLHGLSMEAKGVASGWQDGGREAETNPASGELTAGQGPKSLGITRRSKRSRRIGALLAPDPQAAQWGAA